MSNFVLVKPNTNPLIIPFSPNYRDLQILVEGYFEAIHLTNNPHIVAWINENGKLANLEPTYALCRNGSLVDFIVGNCVFDYIDDEGESIGLSAEYTEFVLGWHNRLPLMTFIINQTEYVLPTINLDLLKGGD